MKKHNKSIFQKFDEILEELALANDSSVPLLTLEDFKKDMYDAYLNAAEKVFPKDETYYNIINIIETGSKQL